MKKSNQDRFPDRLKTASEAKQNKLARFQAAALDPDRLAERAKKAELAATREVKRQAEATKQRQQKEAQQSEDAKREAEQANLRELALKAELIETADQALADEAERKAERDRRYAARRNRKH
jgi:hypothetical protein